MHDSYLDVTTLSVIELGDGFVCFFRMWLVPPLICLLQNYLVKDIHCSFLSFFFFDNKTVVLLLLSMLKFFGVFL